jgi:peptidoglycan/xylan/chitin deacetylase (PgdA/CDA1 family)
MTTSRRTFLLGGAALVATSCAGESAAPPTTTSPVTTASPTTTTTLPSTTTATRPPGPRYIVRGPETTGRVALTFHTDGSEDLARKMTGHLELFSVQATCFIVGRWLDAHPDWAARLRVAGHELANHTYTHPDSESMAPAALQADIARCRDVLVRLTGEPGRFFRPSGTDDGTVTPSDRLLGASAAAGYPDVAGFDVDPFDYRDPGAAAVEKRTLDAARAGSIISLHFGHPGTVEALPRILTGLRAKGLQAVTLSRLLGP